MALFGQSIHTILGVINSILDNIIPHRMDMKVTIDKVIFFLSPQLEIMQESNTSLIRYEYRLQCNGIFYIYYVAERIAERRMSDAEFKRLMSSLFQADAAKDLYGGFLNLKSNSEARRLVQSTIKKVKPIAYSDVEAGIMHSSNFLVRSDIEFHEERRKRANEVIEWDDDIDTDIS